MAIETYYGKVDMPSSYSVEVKADYEVLLCDNGRDAEILFSNVMVKEDGEYEDCPENLLMLVEKSISKPAFKEFFSKR